MQKSSKEHCVPVPIRNIKPIRAATNYRSTITLIATLVFTALHILCLLMHVMPAHAYNKEI